MILTGYGALNKLLGKWLDLARLQTSHQLCRFFPELGGLEEILGEHEEFLSENDEKVFC